VTIKLVMVSSGSRRGEQGPGRQDVEQGRWQAEVAGVSGATAVVRRRDPTAGRRQPGPAAAGVGRRGSRTGADVRGLGCDLVPSGHKVRGRAGCPGTPVTSIRPRRSDQPAGADYTLGRSPARSPVSREANGSAQLIQEQRQLLRSGALD
jgi:hypothetical protein